MCYIIALVAIVLAAVAQLLLKSSSKEDYDNAIKEYLNTKVLLGYFIMGISMILNVYALHQGLRVKELSTLEALNYILIPVLSYFFFHESISKHKLLAICFVLFGIYVFFQ